MITLVKAQVLINIIGALCFRWIMIRLNVPPAVRFCGHSCLLPYLLSSKLLAMV